MLRQLAILAAGVLFGAGLTLGGMTDPARVPWEVFHTVGESAVYGGGPEAADGRLASTPTGMAVPVAACCPAPAPAPKADAAPAGCCG